MTSHDEQAHQTADTEKAQGKRFARIERGELATVGEKVVGRKSNGICGARQQATSIRRSAW